MIKKIVYPQKSELLAEETGIHFGDGYMKIKKDKWGTHYEYRYSAHKNDDYDYIKYVKRLMKTLYNIYPTCEKTYGNGFYMLYQSKNLIQFKMSVGIPLSPKIDLKIPSWIKNNKKFISAFLRGLFDTDGSLMFKSKNGNPHNYPYIHLSLKNPMLIKEVFKYLNTFDISSSLSKHNSIRNNKISVLWDVCISGDKNLNKFLDIIGFSNKKHITKYQIWKKFGFCPINTTLQQRENILNQTLDIASFGK